MKYNKNMKRGITLIEIIVWMALFVVITATTIYMLNPAGQIAGARNKERQLNLEAILNSIRQNMADTSGNKFNCAAGSIPTSTKKMASSGGYDIAPCLVPTYLFNLPYDPGLAGAHYTSVTDYDTGYNIILISSTSEITLSAPGAELKQTISITR
jgi:type II secretory pathway pseudopilin PulG